MPGTAVLAEGTPPDHPFVPARACSWRCEFATLFLPRAQRRPKRLTRERGPPSINLCTAAKKTVEQLEGWVGTMMNSVIARKGPPACRNDEQSPVEAMPAVPVAVSYRRYGLTVAPSLTPTVAPPPRAAVVETKGLAGMPGTVQLRLPRTDSHQSFGPRVSASDPALVVPVIASPVEVLRARELREQLKKRFTDRPSEPCSPWCVGID